MVARSQGVKVDALHVVLIAASVLAMISSAQAVGVILMLGLLVTPAATLYLLTDDFPTMLWGGAFLGSAGSVIGLLLSYRFERIPSGAAIVPVRVVADHAPPPDDLGELHGGIVPRGAAPYVWTCGPRYGLIARLRKRRHFHEESLSRWEHGHEHEKP